MTNVIDYIKWRGDLSFKADPLNKVDQLIFSRLSYIDFDDVGSDGECISSVAERYLADEEKTSLGLLLTKGTKPLVEAIGKCARFESVVIRDYINEIDTETQIQFSAVVFELDEQTAFVAFRGTDDSLVGWKEDLNMSFMDAVPAQLRAADYLNGVMESYAYVNVHVGGHSKGGNLAIYAAVHLTEAYKSSIASVISFDGPGFKTSMVESENYQEMSDRISTIIPKSSVVGLLLEHDGRYQVVESNQLGLLQHDVLSWEVIGKEFTYLPDIDDDARMVDLATKRSLEKMSQEQREAFATILFDVLEANDSKTLTDLSQGGLKGFFKMSEAYRTQDEASKKVISDAIHLFFEESYRSFLEVSELDQIGQMFKEWNERTTAEVDALIHKLWPKSADQQEEST